MPELVPDLPQLSADEQRVLGSLLEKEVTVPSTYPMSVNAVRTACNQASSREPVVDYDERHVHDVLRALKDKDLVAVTWADSGRRTMKYLQKLVARLELSDERRALLTVLLLRGAQPPGALKTRTERLHAFADRADVERCLAEMAELEPPLVRELPRGPREQDNRWIHLLGPVELPAAAPGPAGAGPDREAVLAGGAEARDAKVRATYAAVAQSYADALGDELDDQPFERWLLARVADLAGPHPVVEVGCGPGHVSAHLASLGVETTGLDLVPEMVEVARSRHPEVTFEVGDLRRLMKPHADDGWGAVLAWYSLIHLAPSEWPEALDALVRATRPDGWVVLGLQAGDRVRTHETWFGHEVDLDVVMADREATVAAIERAGLVDVEWYLRSALTSRGESSDRLYVLGRRPGA